MGPIDILAEEEQANATRIDLQSLGRDSFRTRCMRSPTIVLGSRRSLRLIGLRRRTDDRPA